jgi:hypothetical protein
MKVIPGRAATHHAASITVSLHSAILSLGGILPAPRCGVGTISYLNLSCEGRTVAPRAGPLNTWLRLRSAYGVLTLGLTNLDGALPDGNL